MAKPNKAPTAILTGPASVHPWEPVNVDGSQSFDPDPNGIKSFSLQWGNGRTEKGNGRPGLFNLPDGYALLSDGAPLDYDVVLFVFDKPNQGGAGGSAKLTIHVEATSVPQPIDCVMSDWVFQSATPWSDCVEGQQSRTETWVRSIVTPPANGGAECGPSSEDRVVTQACPVDCVLSDWRLSFAEEWGPCQPDNTQTRQETWVRDIVVPPFGGGAPCGPTSETRIGTQSCIFVPPTNPIDCVLSDWQLSSFGPWGPCQSNGTQTRSETWTRTILTQPSDGGKPCGPTEEQRIGTQNCTYVPPSTGDPNADYDEWITRPDFWKGYSLRPRAGAPQTSPYYEKQLLGTKNGGYAANPATGDLLSIIHDPAIDWARVTIPAYVVGTRQLRAAMVPSTPNAVDYLNISTTPDNHVTLFIEDEEALVDYESIAYDVVAIQLGVGITTLTLSAPVSFPNGMKKEVTLPHVTWMNNGVETTGYKVDHPITILDPTHVTFPAELKSVGTLVAGQDRIIYTGDAAFIRVKRGQSGTAAVAHANGTSFGSSVNSIQYQVNFPLGTEDGHSYLFVYDVVWTNSFIHCGLTNHKVINLRQPGIWFELNSNYGGGTGGGTVPGFNKDTDVAALQVRSYLNVGGPAIYDPAKAGFAGPNVTDTEPLDPQLHPFVIKPDRAIRLVIRIDQRAGDYDLVSGWVMDEVTGPVQLWNELQISVSSGKIDVFNDEWNTSTSAHVRGNRRDLVALQRNVGIWRDVPLANVSDFFRLPIKGF